MRARTHALSLFAAAATVSCASESALTPGPSGLQGIVAVGPLASGDEIVYRGLPVTVVIRALEGREVSRATADPEGRYAVALPAGDYSMSMEGVPGGGVAEPVSVRSDEWTTVDVQLELPASGLAGTVTVGPTCPNATWPPDPGCVDRPYSATLVVEDLLGNEVASTVADARGLYWIELDPGAYRLVPQRPSPSGEDTGPYLHERYPLPPNAKIVTVPSTSWAMYDLSYDSGIR